MSQIDWSKAPEGAEYARKTTAGVDWYKRDALGIWVYMANNGEWTAAMWTSEKDCEQRPAWTGEGLPPVGTYVEHKSSAKWNKVLVVAHFNGQAVIAWESDYGDSIDLREASELRPIRTPEQIAAETRRSAISAMLRSEPAMTTCMAANLYDAGYRKLETKES